MQGRKTTHRQAHHVGPIDPQVVEHGDGVVARVDLRIARAVFRHIGRRKTARVVGDAAEIAREKAHLRLPAAMIAGELVDEDERRAAAGFLVMEPGAVLGTRVGHQILVRGGLR